MRRWAVSPTQPLVAGPGARAGAVVRPQAGFRCWAGWLAVRSSIFQSSCVISEAFFNLFFMFCLLFLFKLISLFKF
jgi:hypothetical protein